MPREKVNDESVLARIRAMKVANPGMSDREAIRRCESDHRQHRRLQDRLTEERRRGRAGLKGDVADAHASSHPVSRDTVDGVTRLSAAVPVEGGVASVTVTFDAGAPGRRPGGIRCDVVWHGKGIRPWPGQRGALDALGLAPAERDGVLAMPDGACPAVAASADALVRAWLAAGVPPSPELVDEALGVEADRYDDLGMSALAGLWDADGAFVVATCGDLALAATAAMPGMDPARRMLLRSLGTLAGEAVAAMPHEEARCWSSRVHECLVTLHGPESALARRLGRGLALPDAAWLDRTVGRHDLPPVAPGTLALLVRFRGCVSPSRVATARDAAGLVALVDAVEVLADGDAQAADVVLDLLADRLDRGGDDRGYGDVVADLGALQVDGAGLVGRRMAGLPGLAPALAAATLGIERLRERVALALLVPTFAMSCPEAPDVESCERLAGPLGDRVAANSLEMVAGGRDMVALSRLALSFDLDDDAAHLVAGYDVPSASVDAALRRRLVAAVDDASLDGDWAMLSRWLVPRWRLDGRSLYADRVRPLHAVGKDPSLLPALAGAVRKGISRLGKAKARGVSLAGGRLALLGR